VSTSLKVSAVAASLAGLVLANLAMATHPIDTSAITSQQSRQDIFSVAGTAGDAGQASDLSKASFAEWFSRPLFAKNRRPWEPPRLPPSPPKRIAQPEKPVVRQVDPPDFNLIGISISAARAKALVRRNSELPPVWVSEGDAVGDWTVSAIGSQSIIVRQADRTASVNLYPDVSPKQ